MIFDGLVYLAYLLVSTLVGVLPSAGDTSWVSTVGATLGGVVGRVKAADAHFPATVMLFCIALLISVEVIILAFRGGLWVYRHIPFLQ